MVATEADAFAANVLPMVESLDQPVSTTFAALPSAQSARSSQRGGRWHVSNVRNVIA
jgi:hypothetical protein